MESREFSAIRKNNLRHFGASPRFRMACRWDDSRACRIDPFNVLEGQSVGSIYGFTSVWMPTCLFICLRNVDLFKITGNRRHR
jgi:hypothetical protein